MAPQLPKKDTVIMWSDGACVEFSQIREAYNNKLGGKKKKFEQMELPKDEIPSLWDYSPRCLPREFVNMKQDAFLSDPSGMNLCFLGAEVLAKICANLPPSDFVNLSLTCRYLLWRIFTFCTCYPPNTVEVCIQDSRLYECRFLFGYSGIPKLAYYCDVDYTLLKDPSNEDAREYIDVQKGPRGLFVFHPDCLKKPFVFDTLELSLRLEFFRKEDYDRCLPVILSLRKYARRLNLIIHYYRNGFSDSFFSEPDTKFFLEAVNPTSRLRLHRWDIAHGRH